MSQCRRKLANSLLLFNFGGRRTLSFSESQHSNKGGCPILFTFFVERVGDHKPRPRELTTENCPAFADNFLPPAHNQSMNMTHSNVLTNHCQVLTDHCSLTIDHFSLLYPHPPTLWRPFFSHPIDDNFISFNGL